MKINSVKLFMLDTLYTCIVTAKAGFVNMFLKNSFKKYTILSSFPDLGGIFFKFGY